MSQWSIIQFTNGGTELVPNTWVQGDKVFWPPYPPKDTAKLRAAVNRRDEPSSGWHMYQPIKVLCSRGTFEEAQRSIDRYLRQHCDTTDMESDGEDSRRLKRPNPNYVNDEFDRGSKASKHQYPAAPKVLLPATASTTLQSPPNKSPIYHNLEPLSSSSPQSTNLPVLQSSAMLSFAEDFPAITHHAEMPAVHPFQEFSPEDTRDTARQALKDVALQKLLAMVTELSSEVRELRKEVQEFRQSCRCCQPVRGVGQQVAQADVLELPLRSIDAFERAEDVLQTSEACKALVTRLAVVGGNNLESRVRRILSLLLTNEVASGLNWAGKRSKEDGRQKRAFRDTRLCKCIYDALTQQPGMNDLVFTQAVQKWLRYAPDRTGGVARAERHN
ncbi:uncharacterized protein LOC132875242 [Neoarius graeffei]|uniref:uncharacterized protein LOC132875242 n=1 Tax=Neoarius graeffei TaxID=443677 RepID=UPI00298BC977|nr:uncharacterized protein LOC132875242 [Neoarius graeffei]